MDLERVLRDLHKERRWLENLIGALELASDCPGLRLMRTLNRSLPGGRPRRRGLRLGNRRKTQLSRLAGMVRQHYGTNGRRLRHE